jgi:small GTP-binding protein
MIGDAGVGKTTILEYFTIRSFNESQISTIGVDYNSATVLLDGEPVILQIWDTAGQEKYRSIATQYIRGASGVIVTFSLTDRESFHNVRIWMDLVDQCIGSGVSCVLVGNKSDLPNRAIAEGEGGAMAQRYELEYFETSAKTGQNVNLVFEVLARQMVTRPMGVCEETPVVLEKPGPAAAREKSCC